jgi:hypothetical protein
MHAIAAEIGTFEFLDSPQDDGRPVNWLHLAVASIMMSMTAFGLSLFTQILS